MGTVGPGSIHLLNGLYDAKKSHAPVLAICGQVPLAELGSDFFQEVDNDALFADVAVFASTITSAEQMPEPARAGRQRRARPSAASRCSRCPATSAGSTCPKDTRRPRFVAPRRRSAPDADASATAAALIDAAGQGHAAGRHRRARGPRRGARAGRAAGRADGADAQGQGGLRATTTRSRSARPA